MNLEHNFFRMSTLTFSRSDIQTVDGVHKWEQRAYIVEYRRVRQLLHNLGQWGEMVMPNYKHAGIVYFQY